MTLLWAQDSRFNYYLSLNGDLRLENINDNDIISTILPNVYCERFLREIEARFIIRERLDSLPSQTFSIQTVTISCDDEWPPFFVEKHDLHGIEKVYCNEYNNKNVESRHIIHKQSAMTSQRINRLIRRATSPLFHQKMRVRASVISCRRLSFILQYQHI